tara:strand:+ start:51 stop:422 length:372 start_codon:yes stop_codon:yes gene_type:complete
MKQQEINWRHYFLYFLVFVFVLLVNNAFGQNICKTDICVVEFNSGWNKTNSVDWLGKLSDCSVKRINIDNGDWAKKYNIVVVPTIIIFNGKEVKRYQADISFTIAATRKEIQEEVDELIMSDF